MDSSKHSDQRTATERKQPQNHRSQFQRHTPSTPYSTIEKEDQSILSSDLLPMNTMMVKTMQSLDVNNVKVNEHNNLASQTSNHPSVTSPTFISFTEQVEDNSTTNKDVSISSKPSIAKRSCKVDAPADMAFVDTGNPPLNEPSVIPSLSTKSRKLKGSVSFEANMELNNEQSCNSFNTKDTFTSSKVGVTTRKMALQQKLNPSYDLITHIPYEKVNDPVNVDTKVPMIENVQGFKSIEESKTLIEEVTLPESTKDTSEGTALIHEDESLTSIEEYSKEPLRKGDVIEYSLHPLPGLQKSTVLFVEGGVNNDNPIMLDCMFPLDKDLHNIKRVSIPRRIECLDRFGRRKLKKVHPLEMVKHPGRSKPISSYQLRPSRGERPKFTFGINTGNLFDSSRWVISRFNDEGDSYTTTSSDQRFLDELERENDERKRKDKQKKKRKRRLTNSTPKAANSCFVPTKNVSSRLTKIKVPSIPYNASKNHRTKGLVQTTTKENKEEPSNHKRCKILSDDKKSVNSINRKKGELLSTDSVNDETHAVRTDLHNSSCDGLEIVPAHSTSIQHKTKGSTSHNQRDKISTGQNINDPYCFLSGLSVEKDQINQEMQALRTYSKSLTAEVPTAAEKDATNNVPSPINTTASNSYNGTRPSDKTSNRPPTTQGIIDSSADSMNLSTASDRKKKSKPSIHDSSSEDDIQVLNCKVVKSDSKWDNWDKIPEDLLAMKVSSLHWNALMEENSNIPQYRPFIEVVGQFSSKEQQMMNKITKMLPQEKIVDGYFFNLEAADLHRLLGKERWIGGTTFDFVRRVLNSRQSKIQSNAKILDLDFSSALFPPKTTSGIYQFNEEYLKSTLKPFKSMFKSDKIYIPICLYGKHFSLGVMDMRKRRFLYEDSLRMDGGNYMKLMFAHLREMNKSDSCPFDPVDPEVFENWTFVNVKGLPRQNDIVNCGIFTLLYLDRSWHGCPMDFEESHLNFVREFLAIAICYSKKSFDERFPMASIVGCDNEKHSELTPDTVSTQSPTIISTSSKDQLTRSQNRKDISLLQTQEKLSIPIGLSMDTRSGIKTMTAENQSDNEGITKQCQNLSISIDQVHLDGNRSNTYGDSNDQDDDSASTHHSRNDNQEGQMTSTTMGEKINYCLIDSFEYSTEYIKDLVKVNPNRYLSSKKKFYQKYIPLYNSTRNSTGSLRTDAELKEYITMLRQKSNDAKEKVTQSARSIYKKYSLGTGIDTTQLYRGNLVVPCVEMIYDIIMTEHSTLGHPRCVKVMKKQLDVHWYKIPRKAVQLFMEYCPTCNDKMKFKTDPQVPAKMIISNAIGERAQVDLMNFSKFNISGMAYILRFVDCLSGYGMIRCLVDKSSRVVAEALVSIMSGCIRPYILQSDNGSEFLKYCIRTLKTHFRGVKLIKGRPRHPQSQGCVERSNRTFKEALEKKLSEECVKDDYDWRIAAYVTSMQINGRAHHGRKFTVPYQSYFTISNDDVKFPFTASDKVINACTTEYAMMGMEELHARIKSDMFISDPELLDFISVLNEIWNIEASHERDREQFSVFDSDSRVTHVVNTFIHRNTIPDAWTRLMSSYKESITPEECCDDTDVSFCTDIDDDNRSVSSDSRSGDIYGDAGDDERYTDGGNNETDVKSITLAKNHALIDKKRKNTSLCVLGQQQQAERVNRKRTKINEEQVGVGDVVGIDAHQLTTLMILGIVLKIKKGKFQIRTKHGIIKKWFTRAELKLLPDMNKGMLGIEDIPDEEQQQLITEPLNSIISKFTANSLTHKNRIHNKKPK